MLIGGGGTLANLYLVRLVWQLVPSRAWRGVLIAVLALMSVVLFARDPIRDLGPDVRRVWESVAYPWLAFALYLSAALLVSDLVRLCLAIARRVRRKPAKAPGGEPVVREAPSDFARRDFVTRALPWTVLAGGGVTAAYGTLRAFTPAEVSTVEVRLPRFPHALEGLTIVQLTDIHVGSFVRREFMDALVEETNALRPDVVAITGDLVDGDVGRLGEFVGRLANLEARYGRFFVTGNHEYYSGVEQWTAFLESIGISVLRNRRVQIGDASASFDLVGVDDWSGSRWREEQRYDLERALAGRDPERAAVLLAHQPMNFEEAVRSGIGLQVSGHTHGGQLFPFTSLVGIRYPYHRGHYTHEDGHLYVSRGCGFWGPPARVGSAPEIVQIVLRS
jgi:predicted MPP superfamily phosphohydrolase